MGRKELGLIGPNSEIHSIHEIPLIKGKISPLRCLAQHWQEQAKRKLNANEKYILCRAANELTAALNRIDHNLG